jgi:hypothetical protein
MQKYKLLALLLLTAPVAYGQYIGLGLGYALPSGTFANKDMSRSESGFAKNGYTFGLQVNYKVLKNLGICVDVNHNVMDLDEAAYTNVLQKLNPNTTVDVDAVDAYSANTALAGAYAFIPLKKFSVQLKFAFGFASMKVPEKRITQLSGGKEYITVEESRSSMAPAFGWGFGVNYELSRLVFLNFRVDETYAYTKFDFDYRSSNDALTPMPLNFYTAMLGVGIRIQE